MYSIRQNGAEIGVADQASYIYLQSNGFYAPCGIERAQGFCADNKLFAMPGHGDTLGLTEAELVEEFAEKRLADAESDTTEALAILRGEEETNAQ